MITYEILNNDPFIALIHGLIPQDTISDMLNETEFVLSTGYDHGTADSRLVKHRTSSTCYVQHRYYDLTKLTLSYIQKEFGHSYHPDQAEQWQLTRYRPGEFFKPHWDYFNLPGYENLRNPDRTATVILYLNDDFQGGSTNFNRLNIDVTPRRGSCLYFAYPDDPGADLTMHEGVPVTTGIKTIATLWISDPMPKL
jgi:prolyl 4-hydroxylase